jgi:hypothetical protein
VDESEDNAARRPTALACFSGWNSEKQTHIIACWCQW